MTEKVYVVAALRTPFGKFGGKLKNIESIDLCAKLIEGILDRSQIKSVDIDQVHLGCCIQFEPRDSASPIIARQALLRAGLPPQTLSSTVDKACCSSTEAIKKAYDLIRLREADVIIAGGVDMMSRTPHVVRDVRWGSKLGSFKMEDPLFPIEYKDFSPISVDAGEVALEYGISREEQDLWAYNSQQRYKEAEKAGKFETEIMAIHTLDPKKGVEIFDKDEFPNPHTTIEGLKRLPTIYGSPTVTPGNAPGINDGAAVVILISERKMKELDLEPLAEIVTIASVADEPRYIARVPAFAISKALQSASISLEQVKNIEINEAFAAVPLVSSKILGDGDDVRIKAIRERLNVNGGSIAIGHPVGATGARILSTLIYELKRLGGGYGVSAICGGLAQGDAIVVKV